MNVVLNLILLHDDFLLPDQFEQSQKDADHFVSLGDVATAKSARTIAIDTTTGRLFLPAADIEKMGPADANGRARPIYKAGSLKLLVYAPAK